MLALATRLPRRRLIAKATANVTANPPKKAPAKPNCLTWSAVILDIAVIISAGKAR